MEEQNRQKITSKDANAQNSWENKQRGSNEELEQIKMKLNGAKLCKNFWT